jgi:hypothetical protein
MFAGFHFECGFSVTTGELFVREDDGHLSSEGTGKSPSFAKMAALLS